MNYMLGYSSIITIMQNWIWLSIINFNRLSKSPTYINYIGLINATRTKVLALKMICELMFYINVKLIGLRVHAVDDNE